MRTDEIIDRCGAILINVEFENRKFCLTKELKRKSSGHACPYEYATIIQPEYFESDYGFAVPIFACCFRLRSF